MAASNRFTSVQAFQSEAQAIHNALPDVALSRISDALAMAQGYKDADALIDALTRQDPVVALEMHHHNGDIYFKGPLRKTSHDSWHALLSDLIGSDYDLGKVKPATCEDEFLAVEGSLYAELLPLERLPELSSVINAFCEQNRHKWPRGELFNDLLETVLNGVADESSDVSEMLTDAMAGAIDGVELEQVVSEDVNLWTALGDNAKSALKLAETAYSPEALKEAKQSLRLRMGASASQEQVDDAAPGVLLERDFRLMVEAVLGTIFVQSNPGCIDGSMMAEYAKDLRQRMTDNARLSVFCGERLLLEPLTR